MGPLTLPEAPRKRRWGWLFLWTLLVFAGGVAVGLAFADQASPLIERACAILGISPPHFVNKVKPPVPETAPAAPLIEPLPSAPPEGDKTTAGEPRGEPPAGAAEAPARRVDKAVEPEKPAIAAAPQAVAHAAVVEAPAARPSHAKSETKASAAKAAPARSGASAPEPAPAIGAYRDPFVSDDDRPKQPPAAAGRKPKPSFDDAEPTAKSEPATKPAAPKSGDSLDNLMADVVTDTKGKSKPREGKGLDALLKDVQSGKSEPAPAPKREAPEALPQLSPADISKVMVGVKMRSKDCAQQLGQKGIAEVKLAVGKDGAVTDVTVGGKMANTPIAACIQKAARAASFPRSAGLRFDYRIDLR